MPKQKHLKPGRVKTDNQRAQGIDYPQPITNFIDKLTEPENLLTFNQLLSELSISDEDKQTIRDASQEECFWEVVSLTNRKKIKRLSYLASNRLIAVINDSNSNRDLLSAIQLLLRLTGDITERANIFSPSDYAIATQRIISMANVDKTDITKALKRSETGSQIKDEELELE